MRLKRKNKKNIPIQAAQETEEASVDGALPRQALLEHLKALRNVIIVSVAALAAGFLVMFLGFSDQLLAFIKSPINARGIDLIYLSLYETLATQMKVSFIAGAVVASPVVFWCVWSFVKPALYPREGRIVLSLFFVTVFLFLLGAVFAYLIVFQMAVNFFLVTSAGIATPFISIEKYTDFLVGFVLPFGLTFELPVVMVIVTRSGILPVSFFTKCRKFIIFAIFLIAAILTPPDVVSQVLLALPLVLLFEIGILASKIMRKRYEKQRGMEN
ncbi:MAG: twin-arginine translocase subunit TatC [Treponema sp.]|jgi:sec-independent protein translocase protein TatC|nr:twin-arginine translocase subunit TatC [Treponema sp.]